MGDLQAFLQTKWGVGVKAVPDREGEPHSSGGQFLKLLPQYSVSYWHSVSYCHYGCGRHVPLSVMVD